MKFIRNTLDRLHPMFAEGGKLKRLYPLYEAIDTFLYTPGAVTKGLTHIRDAIDLKRMMTMVVISLIPCVFMACWNTGYQANMTLGKMKDAGILSSAYVDSAEQIVSPKEYAAYSKGEAKPEFKAPAIAEDAKARATPWQYRVFGAIGFKNDANSFLSNFIFGLLHFLPVYIVCMAVGGTCELAFSVVRGHEINEGFLVTGLLFPLTLPPTIPLWQVGLGIAFGVVIGKEIFGGTGRNFLNPALTARCFLYFNNPLQISGSDVWTAVDGFSGATALGQLASANLKDGMNALNTVTVPWGTESISWWSSFIGTIQGSMGETSALACLIGAVILIATGIGSWRIMAGTVIGAVAFSGLLYVFSNNSTNPMFLVPPWWHLVIGGFAFGTVFMATDPVSAAMTDTGKWIYGLLIGFMTILIRAVNPAFPEGIMLAILFGNVFAPLIDFFVAQANIKRRAARYAA